MERIKTLDTRNLCESSKNGMIEEIIKYLEKKE